MVSPPSILFRVSRIASSTTALPAVRAVISSASRIETPDARSVDSVRQKRATAILRIRLPSTGIFSTEASTILRPAGRSEEHTSELQSQSNLVCRLLLEKKKKN